MTGKLSETPTFAYSASSSERDHKVNISFYCNPCRCTTLYASNVHLLRSSGVLARKQIATWVSQYLKILSRPKEKMLVATLYLFVEYCLPQNISKMFHYRPIC